MTDRSYYEDELAYLHEVGAAFGRANPDVAGLLSRKATDPDVERLLEGFAFLTGRLRARLDEQLPELSQGMLSLLWPHYLRPVPSMSIVAFAPPPDGTRVSIAEGATILSRPVEGVACRFSVCHRHPVLPAVVEAVTLEERATSARLTVTLRTRGHLSAGALAAGGVRLFLHDERDEQLGLRLLHLMLTQSAGIKLGIGTAELSLPPQAVRHAGFAAGEGVLPWPGNSFGGYRILQEYLLFPARFRFVDLLPVPGAADLAGDTLRIGFELRQPPGLASRLRPESVHLNCVPVVNLHETAAEPLRPRRSVLEHRLVPASAGGRLGSVHSVLAVEGTVRGQPDRIVFPPFAAMHRAPDATGAFHRLRLRPAVARNRFETWISFVDPQDRAMVPRVDTVSAQLLCTDGPLPELLPLGAIDRPGPGVPAGLAVSSIIPATAELPPPLGGDSLWRLVSGLARDAAPLSEVTQLRALVAAYDFRAPVDERARQRLALLLDGLQGIEQSGFDTLVRGIPMRGREVTLRVAESGFGGIEGAFLFGAVFDAFLDAHANVNTCIRTVIEGAETRLRHRWPQRGGGLSPL